MHSLETGTGLRAPSNSRPLESMRLRRGQFTRLIRAVLLDTCVMTTRSLRRPGCRRQLRPQLLKRFDVGSVKPVPNFARPHRVSYKIKELAPLTRFAFLAVAFPGEPDALGDDAAQLGDVVERKIIPGQPEMMEYLARAKLPHPDYPAAE